MAPNYLAGRQALKFGRDDVVISECLEPALLLNTCDIGKRRDTQREYGQGQVLNVLEDSSYPRVGTEQGAHSGDREPSQVHCEEQNEQLPKPESGNCEASDDTDVDDAINESAAHEDGQKAEQDAEDH